jgi:hypothetical protein
MGRPRSNLIDMLQQLVELLCHCKVPKVQVVFVIVFIVVCMCVGQRGHPAAGHPGRAVGELGGLGEFLCPKAHGQGLVSGERML